MPRARPQAPTMQDVGDPKSLIVQAFKQLTPPKGPFDPDKVWTQIYQDCSSFKLKHVQGEIAAQHKNGSLHIQSFRNCREGYRYYTIADLTCSRKGWHAPVSWTVESKAAKSPNGRARLHSGQTKKMSVGDGVLTIEEGKAERTEKLPGLYTCKWCLLDAVGRLATLGKKKIEFTLIDEYDELCPNQTITFRGKKVVQTKAGKIDVSCYQHTGVATVPGVYYVDAAGRVLVYLGGMQLLSLTKAVGGLK